MGSDRKMTLGEYLRSEREQRGITLEQVASATKVGIRTLHALEGDHYAELPAKPYIRGFVASYCSFIGLDPNEVRAKYEDFIQVKSQERPNRDAGHSGYAFEKKDGQQESRLLLFIAMCSFLIIGGITMFVLKPSLKHRRSSHIEKLKQAEEQEQKLAQAPSPTPSSAATSAPTTNPQISTSPSSSGTHPQAVGAVITSNIPSPSPSPGVGSISGVSSLVRSEVGSGVSSAGLMSQSPTLDLSSVTHSSLSSPTPLLGIDGGERVRVGSTPLPILPSPNVSIPKMPTPEPVLMEEFKPQLLNPPQSENRAGGQPSPQSASPVPVVQGPSPSPASRVIPNESSQNMSATPSPIPSISNTPSPLPSVGLNSNDPLDSGHDLNPAEVKHRMVFQVQKDVWVRYRVDERPMRKFVIRAGRSLVLKAQNRLVFQVSDPSAVTFIHNQAGAPQLMSESPRTKIVHGEATLSYVEGGSFSAADVLSDHRPLPKQVEPKKGTLAP